MLGSFLMTFFILYLILSIVMGLICAIFNDFTNKLKAKTPKRFRWITSKILKSSKAHASASVLQSFLLLFVIIFSSIAFDIVKPEMLSGIYPLNRIVDIYHSIDSQGEVLHRIEPVVAFAAVVVALLIYFYQEFSLTGSLNQQLEQIHNFGSKNIIGFVPLSADDAKKKIEDLLEEKKIDQVAFVSRYSAIPYFWLDKKMADQAIVTLTNEKYRKIAMEFVGPDIDEFKEISRKVARTYWTGQSKANPRIDKFGKICSKILFPKLPPSIARSTLMANKQKREKFEEIFVEKITDQYKKMRDQLHRPMLNCTVSEEPDLHRRSSNYAIVRKKNPGIDGIWEYISFDDQETFKQKSLLDPSKESYALGAAKRLLGVPVIYSTANQTLIAPVVLEFRHMMKKEE